MLNEVMSFIGEFTVEEISLFLAFSACILSIGSFIFIMYSVISFRSKFDHQKDTIYDKDKYIKNMRTSAEELTDVLHGLKLALKNDRTEK